MYIGDNPSKQTAKQDSVLCQNGTGLLMDHYETTIECDQVSRGRFAYLWAFKIKSAENESLEIYEVTFYDGKFTKHILHMCNSTVLVGINIHLTLI